MILLLDHPTREASFLLYSLQQAGQELRAVYFEDDGFLPEGAESPYRFWCGRQRKEKAHPRYFSRLEVPDGWEIRGTGTEGSVWDYDRQRARIHYALPADKRYIQSVDWLDEVGKTIWTDHYDDQGSLFARTTCDAEGRAVFKSYYTESGEEAITENLQSHGILLRVQAAKSTGTSEQVEPHADRNFIFQNKTEFMLHFLKTAGADCERILLNSLSYPLFVQRRLRADTGCCVKNRFESPADADLSNGSIGAGAFGKPVFADFASARYKNNRRALQTEAESVRENGDILFWQEDVYGKLPGNMVIVMNDPMGIERIAVQSPGVFDKILEQIHDHAKENGIKDPERVEKMVTSLGYLYPVKNPPKQKKSICILTNSDQIEKLEELTNALTDFVFHIGALTEMSDKLLRMQRKPNVRLYPGMTGSRGKELLAGCEFYLDINHGSEVVDAVREAYLQGAVILAFQETRHHVMFTADSNIFSSSDWEKMAEVLRDAASSEDKRQHLLDLQDRQAMRADANEYHRIIG